MKKDFAEKVRDIVKKIPKGKMMTYGTVARLAGSPGAARAVGTIMAANYDAAVPYSLQIFTSGVNLVRMRSSSAS
jgi:alkylated DNA nucleotide flippase Atl1